MNKKISKAIMDRTRLRNKFLRTRSNRDKEAYNKHWNYCIFLFGKLSKSTTTILIIGRLLKTSHFGNISNLFFPIKALTLIR